MKMYHRILGVLALVFILALAGCNNKIPGGTGPITDKGYVEGGYRMIGKVMVHRDGYYWFEVKTGGSATFKVSKEDFDRYNIGDTYQQKKDCG